MRSRQSTKVGAGRSIRVVMLVMLAHATAGCDGGRDPSADPGWFTVGSETYTGLAAISLRDETPTLNLQARTELNVATWYDREGTDGLTLRLYKRTDFRSELLAGGTVTGQAEDMYLTPGDQEPAYVAENAGAGTYNGTGQYRVSFEAERRVRGSFDVEMTTYVDRMGNQLEFEPRQVSASFDLPYSLVCWVAPDPEHPGAKNEDPRFESEFCRPFKHLADVPGQ